MDKTIRDKFIEIGGIPVHTAPVYLSPGENKGISTWFEGADMIMFGVMKHLTNIISLKKISVINVISTLNSKRCNSSSQLTKPAVVAGTGVLSQPLNPLNIGFLRYGKKPDMWSLSGFFMICVLYDIWHGRIAVAATCSTAT